MKAITICQPFAHLIVTPQAELPPDVQQKRVENRSWATTYCGLLAIHAGKNPGWLEPDDDGERDAHGILIADMAFGAVVGVVEQVACVHFKLIERHRRLGNVLPKELCWLATHQHSEGPWCHIYESARRLVEPLPFRGGQGFFDVPDEAVAVRLPREGVRA